MNYLACLVLAVALAGCTTGRYSDKPTPVQGQADTYRFKVYVGGFAGEESAAKALEPDLVLFKAANSYQSYTVVNRFYNPFPSYFDYTVKFMK